MARFRKWLRGILSDVHERNNDPTAPEPALPPGLPGLPPKRKHVLTPRPSREDITYLQESNGAFFERLPSELRDQIFLFAFGNRIVHIDLQFEHPKLSDPSRHLAHAQVSANADRDLKVHPRWAWWSSVCHRHPIAEPWDDRCQSGLARKMCDAFYPGDGCFLGAMGWLLTCRQA